MGVGSAMGRLGQEWEEGRATWCLLLQQEGPRHQKAAGTPLGKTLPLGGTQALGVLSAWVPLGTRLFGPRAWEGALVPPFYRGGLGLDTLVKQSMSSKVLDSRPSLDFGLRPSLQQEADTTDQSCLRALATPPSHLECA